MAYSEANYAYVFCIDFEQPISLPNTSIGTFLIQLRLSLKLSKLEGNLDVSYLYSKWFWRETAIKYVEILASTIGK